MFCPLCNDTSNYLFHKDKNREYYQCNNCKLVFVPPKYHLSTAEEKARYDLHQNNPDDEGYKRFLGRFFIPVKQRLKENVSGLDFGSGPGPTLSKMFKEKGFTVNIFDHFYANNPEVLNKQYDFITATEVVEHLHNPKDELDHLFNILKAGGIFGIMTKLVLDQKKFTNWHYTHDMTHVCFYSELTFRWLADKWNANVEFVGNDVIIFKK